MNIEEIKNNIRLQRITNTVKTNFNNKINSFKLNNINLNNNFNEEIFNDDNYAKSLSSILLKFDKLFSNSELKKFNISLNFEDNPKLFHLSLYKIWLLNLIFCYSYKYSFDLLKNKSIDQLELILDQENII